MVAPRKVALIVVDVQEDFCETDGTLAVKGSREIAPTINKLLGMPFALKLATRDHHPADHISFASRHGRSPFTSSLTIPNPAGGTEEQKTTLWPDHCVQNTPGSELIPEIEWSEVSEVFKKGEDKRVESYSGFGPPFCNPPVGMSGLGAALRQAGIDDVVVVGLAYDYCVKYTARDAEKQGYQTFVVEDATRAVDQSKLGLSKTREQLEKSGVTVLRFGGEEELTELELLAAGQTDRLEVRRFLQQNGRVVC